MYCGKYTASYLGSMTNPSTGAVAILGFTYTYVVMSPESNVCLFVFSVSAMHDLHSADRLSMDPHDDADKQLQCKLHRKLCFCVTSQKFG